MSFLPGTSRNDQFGDTRIDPDDAAKVIRLVTWGARTDAEETRFLSQLGLDEPIPYTLTDQAVNA